MVLLSLSAFRMLVYRSSSLISSEASGLSSGLRLSIRFMSLCYFISREKWDRMLDNSHSRLMLKMTDNWSFQQVTLAPKKNMLIWNDTHLKAKFLDELWWKITISYIIPNLKVSQKVKKQQQKTLFIHFIYIYALQKICLILSILCLVF